MYRRLDSNHLVTTAATLLRRIEERFPGSGLGRVAGELQLVTTEAAAKAQSIAKPNWLFRGLLVAGLLALLIVLGMLASQLKLTGGAQGWSEFLQGLEALVNDIIFAGFAVYFLIGLETRIKRKRILAALHTLRSLAHRRLVVELGRADAPGRPILYGTGIEFLARFGLATLEDLPPLEAEAAGPLADLAGGVGPGPAPAR